MPRLTERFGAYLMHHFDEALHVESGQTVKGWLEEEQVEMLGDGMSPSVAIQSQLTFETERSRLEAVPVQAEDHLTINGKTYVVEEEPRGDDWAVVRLRKPYAE